MYLDDSNFAIQSNFKTRKKPMLLVNNNCRIAKEEEIRGHRNGFMLCLLLVFTFLIISGWDSMIQPQVLHG